MNTKYFKHTAKVYLWGDDWWLYCDISCVTTQENGIRLSCKAVTFGFTVQEFFMPVSTISFLFSITSSVIGVCLLSFVLLSDSSLLFLKYTWKGTISKIGEIRKRLRMNLIKLSFKRGNTIVIYFLFRLDFCTSFAIISKCFLRYLPSVIYCWKVFVFLKV